MIGREDTKGKDLASQHYTVDVKGLRSDSNTEACMQPHRPAIFGNGLPKDIGGEALVPILKLIARHTNGAAILIDKDLQVVAHTGNFFGFEQDVRALHDIKLIANRLGDFELMRQPHAIFSSADIAGNDFVTLRGYWLRRTVSLLDVSESLALITYRDVTHEHLQRFVSECQRIVMIALAQHQPLKTVFQALTVLLEDYSAPGSYASVLWLQPEGLKLRHIASPSLPKTYTDAIDGIEIGPRVGSCGTAAYTRKRIIAEDIASDELWRDYKDLALAAGLRACWSQPILSPSGSVLGTLAMYRDRIGTPSDAEICLLDIAAQIASVTIRDLRTEDELRFQATLLDSVREAVIATDHNGLVRYWGRGAEELLGYAANEVQGQQLNSVLEIADCLQQVQESGMWNGELNLHDNHGSIREVEISVSPVADKYKSGLGHVAILHDVSARRAAEKRVLEQSRRHRAVAYLGHLALSDIDLSTLFEFTLESLSKILDVPLCKVLELEPSGDSLLLRAGIGWHKDMIGSARIASDKSTQAGFTLRSVTPVIIEDMRTDKRFNGADLLQDYGVVSGLSVVIHGINEKPYGVLAVHTTQRHYFSEHDINFLQSVSNVLAESIRRKTINESLRNSEQSFRDLADSMPQIVWSADMYGRIDYFNLRWRKTIGTHHEPSNTEAWLAALHADYRAEWVATWENCVRLRKPFEMECRLYDLSYQNYRWQLVRALPVSTGNNFEIRWYGSCTDIDEQKRTEHRLRQQTRELEMVNWINSTLLAELDLEKLVQTVIDVGTQLSSAHFGAYFHAASTLEQPAYSLYAVSGVSRETFQEVYKPLITALFGESFRGQGVVRVNDLTEDMIYATHVRKIFPENDMKIVRSFLAVPVISRKGEVLGGMFFGHPEPGIFDGDDERLIAGLATQTSIAVDNATVYQDLRASKNETYRQFEQLNAIYATAPVGLCFLDKNLRLISLNDHLLRLAEQDTIDAKGKRLMEALGPAGIALEPMCRSALTERLPALNREISWQQPGKDADNYWLCSCYPILEPDGTVLGVNTVVQDITERKAAEQALRLNEAKLRNQTNELARAHRQKDEFLAMLAHELRNPLAPISNTIQLLKILEPPQREQKLPWAIDLIDRQVLQLSRLVDDLLDIARITRGHIELQFAYVDLRKLVYQTIDVAKPWFESKQQTFEVSCPDEEVGVLGDGARLIQAISNLLNNASKFSPSGSRIHLNLSIYGNEAVVRVADNGIGIAPDILPHVFELFTQADRSLDRRQGGLGLGLSLVRKLTEMHNGRITATSQGIGRGSEFTLYLPLIAADSTHRDEGSDQIQDISTSSQLRIFLVDDNEQSTDAMAMLLETLGHTVAVAYNGPDALQKIEGFKPQIVFLDIGLPMMDGYQVANKLRVRYGKRITIIALTGYSAQQGRQHAHADDFDHYLLKPITLETLLPLLEADSSANA